MKTIDDVNEYFLYNLTDEERLLLYEEFRDLHFDTWLEFLEEKYNIDKDL